MGANVVDEANLTLSNCVVALGHIPILAKVQVGSPAKRRVSVELDCGAVELTRSTPSPDHIPILLPEDSPYRAKTPCPGLVDPTIAQLLGLPLDDSMSACPSNADAEEEDDSAVAAVKAHRLHVKKLVMGR